MKKTQVHSPLTPKVDIPSLAPAIEKMQLENTIDNELDETQPATSGKIYSGETLSPRVSASRSAQDLDIGMSVGGSTAVSVVTKSGPVVAEF